MLNIEKYTSPTNHQWVSKIIANLQIVVSKLQRNVFKSIILYGLEIFQIYNYRDVLFDNSRGMNLQKIILPKDHHHISIFMAIMQLVILIILEKTFQ